MVSNETSAALNSEQDLASIPTAQGGLSRLAIARLKTAGVPAVPLLMRVGLTPEVIADPEERLMVRSQITLLDEWLGASGRRSRPRVLAPPPNPRAFENFGARYFPAYLILRAVYPLGTVGRGSAAPPMPKTK